VLEDLLHPRAIFTHTEFQAQDLGLHRAEAVKQNIEMRRRLWGACVISDRWYFSTYPVMAVYLTDFCCLMLTMFITG
jgi:hypothetical protein